MPPVTLEGDTLGNKRRHYNKLVEDAVANKQYELCDISGDDSDIDNLLKIDIASRNRNVHYIIEVMKSKDMLYAATAIKKSTWLTTEQQYANIINPEYLHTQLLPSMNTKTFNKLMLHIRLNLKDETRVEAFYEYLKDTDNACRWLQNCSIPFIENVIKNDRLVPLWLFTRLCKRSAHFVAYFTRVEKCAPYNVKKKCLFLLKSHPKEIINVLRTLEHNYPCCPALGRKKTEVLMKICAQNVFNNFEKYVLNLDLSVVAKYMNKKEIKEFLCNQMMKKSFRLYLCQYNNLSPFLKNMPEEERFEFVQKLFMNKTELSALNPDYEIFNVNHHIKSYQWYEFAPFNIALIELKKLIHKENSPSERIAMLSVLITCAKRNLEHIKSLLKFFKDKHINEPFKFKNQFINNLLSQLSPHEIDVETWYLLDQLFHSMEVYTKSSKNVQLCLEFIMFYTVLHDEPVPDIIKQKVKFNTFEKNQKKLAQDQNDKIFTYLLHSLLKKVQNAAIKTEADFRETVVQLNNALTLIRDWKRDVSKYSHVLEKIKELNKIKQVNMWKTDMSCLYNVNKSWRKHMFEESLSLCLSEEACLNVLKHKPQLLTRHDKDIDTLRTNDAVSLRRLLAKLRVYWPHSLARHWTEAYLLNLNKPTGQKAVVKGLFSLLHQNQVIDIAKRHKPDDSKVNWGETDQNEISVRKNIAKYLHVARPLIPLHVVLWYAKEDYLQYAVPSLNAILSNLSEVESREYIPQLLDAPVSLQKFGLRLAATKLKFEDLKLTFSNIWKISKNLTIRSALFEHTYDQICKANNPTVQKDFWEILSTFIDNLTAEESAEIYQKVSEVQNVPITIRAEFYMKSYGFLLSLPASANCEKYFKDLTQYALKIMDNLDDDFVINKILSPAQKPFCSYRSEVLEVFACYLMCFESEEGQHHRFNKVLDLAMEEAFHSWGCTRSGEYYVKENFSNFLSFLFWYFRLYYPSKKTLPVQLFIKIKTKMEKGLSLIENYELYTRWKLVTEYVKVIDQHRSMLEEMLKSSKYYELDFIYRSMPNEIETIWNDIHFKILPTFGPSVVKCLKEDTEQYNIPTIYYLFTEALKTMIEDISYQDAFKLEILQHMLNDYNFVPSYFVVLDLTPKYDCSPILLNMRKKIKSHSSKEVRMHYYNNFRDIPEANNQCQ